MRKRSVAMTHGATGDARNRSLARTHGSGFCANFASIPVDSTRGRGYFDHNCRTMAKIELLDRYFDEKGVLDARGSPGGATTSTEISSNDLASLANQAFKWIVSVQKNLSPLR